MGSKSAVIVCEDARLEFGLRRRHFSAFKTTGQRCVSAGRVLVHERLFEQFADRFVAGPGAEIRRSAGSPAAFAGPMMNQAARR